MQKFSFFLKHVHSIKGEVCAPSMVEITRFYVSTETYLLFECILLEQKPYRRNMKLFKLFTPIQVQLPSTRAAYIRSYDPKASILNSWNVANKGCVLYGCNNDNQFLFWAYKINIITIKSLNTVDKLCKYTWQNHVIFVYAINIH